MLVIDAHMHVTDPARFDLAWARPLPRPLDPTPRGYAQACAGTGIIAPVIVETDVTPAQRLGEAVFQAELVASGLAGAGVPCLDPRDPAFAEQATALARMPAIRGVRWMARTEADCQALCHAREVRAHLVLLGRLGLSFDLHVPPEVLVDVVPTVAAAPQTRFLLNHCGHGDPVALGARGQGRPPQHDAQIWRSGMRALSRLPHVACKLSGLVSHLHPGRWQPADLAPVVEHCLESFGAQRCLFGSDWPVCTRGGTMLQWLSALQQIISTLPTADQAQILAGTARTWYRLPAAPADPPALSA